MTITPFIMVLVGCGADFQCNEVATLPVAYASEQSCLAARSEILTALADDTLVAECRRQGPMTPIEASASPTA